MICIFDSHYDIDFAAAERCESSSNMDDSQKIPEDDMDLPNNIVSGSPVDSSDPMVSPAGETEITAIIDVGGSSKYPDDTPVIERIAPADSVLENIASVEVYYQEDESGPWILVTPPGVR